ncbi:MAG: threonine--tRNA ligase, partial [Bacteroidales bacterium]|nr:threonine--tRNA ligase [Bacteroidales bacterium]
LCRGPHLRSTEAIKAVKLTAIAGAYWRGDEKRQQLTRIYGITFPKKSMLEEYLVMMEEAKKRDHRKLGKEMELFTFSQRVGLGLPLWLPRGAVMRNILEGFLRKKQTELGYLPVVTPHIGSKELYITSGHYAKYGKDSFQPIRTPQEGEEYMLKPMNCPHHCEIFRSSPRSYRDLPLRFAEFGTVYRYEQSGELHGLTRVRGFTQDDAHLFCRPDQLQEEFEKVIDLILYVFRTLKMTDYMAQVSLRDPDNKEKYIGSDENWAKAEQAIIDAAEKKGLKTVVEKGEAAFYGPKLDFMVKDAIGRKWQLGTIQVDYNLPERFQLEYTDADGSKKRPVMIHRAPFGSMERFTAVVLEHTAGHLPLWLSPDQVKVLPVSEKYADYAEKVCSFLNNSDIRASIDARNETLGKRIREISLLRVPVLVIVGDKEIQSETVSVRREGADAGSMTLDGFVEYIHQAIADELS